MNHTLELGVNIDHIATLRQARFTPYPSILEAISLIEAAGADAITLHLREDRRHIQDADVYAVRKQLNSRMNLEMAATDEMVAIAKDVMPEDVCLVPEKREELTTEGGLDISAQFDRIQQVTQSLNAADINVSLFIEPDIEQIKHVNAIGAPKIELHTGTYANATGAAREQEFQRIIAAAEFAQSEGIQVNAGHGLDYQNTHEIAAIPQLKELNIGHAMIARAIFIGIKAATEEMLAIMNTARQ